MHDSHLGKLANLLVRYSTAIGPGELVSLVGPPLAEPLLVALYREVLQARSHPIVVMAPEPCAEILCREGSAEQIAFLNPLEVCEVEAVDATIHVLTPENTRALASIGVDRQAQVGKARRPILDVFLRRTAARSLRWAVTQLPCPAAAQDAGLPLAEYEELVFAADLLDWGDPVAAWHALGHRQARLIDFLQTVRELRFVTPVGTDLRVGVAGRTWINCDGHENLPDGEVFTGPIENATEGTLCCDMPTLHGGREVTGVRLVFRAGRVVEATAADGADYLRRVLDVDAGARVLGEVALGCNYAITRPTLNTLLDEKIGGTFHVALGASYPKSGGRNQSGLHWDLVCDLRRGGRVEADGKVISENGRFTNRQWPQLSEALS